MSRQVRRHKRKRRAHRSGKPHLKARVANPGAVARVAEIENSKRDDDRAVNPGSDTGPAVNQRRDNRLAVNLRRDGKLAVNLRRDDKLTIRREVDHEKDVLIVNVREVMNINVVETRNARGVGSANVRVPGLDPHEAIRPVVRTRRSEKGVKVGAVTVAESANIDVGRTRSHGDPNAADHVSVDTGRAQNSDRVTDRAIEINLSLHESPAGVRHIGHQNMAVGHGDVLRRGVRNLVVVIVRVLGEGSTYRAGELDSNNFNSTIPSGPPTLVYPTSSGKDHTNIPCYQATLTGMGACIVIHFMYVPSSLYMSRVFVDKRSCTI